MTSQTDYWDEPVTPSRAALSRFEVLTEEIAQGSMLHFEAKTTSIAETDQLLIIDNIVHHMRAAGETTPKVFKWKTSTLEAGAVLKGRKRDPIRPITTRRYYHGRQKVELLADGEEFGGADFPLLTE